MNIWKRSHLLVFTGTDKTWMTAIPEDFFLVFNAWKKSSNVLFEVGLKIYAMWSKLFLWFDWRAVDLG